MQSVNMNDTPFEGRTSAPPWEGPRPTLECKRCGSSLAGQREAVEKITTRGVCFVREVFRCRCGRGRWIERQEVAKGWDNGRGDNRTLRRQQGPGARMSRAGRTR
jgi:hypothetical protein